VRSLEETALWNALHQPLITAPMTAPGRRVARDAGVDGLDLTGDEVGDGQQVAVALDGAAGAVPIVEFYEAATFGIPGSHAPLRQIGTGQRW
jgi:hypothetical protein